MLVMYDIVHVKPDGTEDLIVTTDNPQLIPMYTETARFKGTWIRDNRKLLRWNTGELHINTRQFEMTVSSYRVMELGTMPMYELTIRYGDQLHKVHLNGFVFIGLDINKRVLWQVEDISDLLDHVDKQLAYQIQEYYDKFVDEFKLLISREKIKRELYKLVKINRRA